MKRNFIRKSLLTLCMITFMIVSIVGVVFTLPTKSEKAAATETAWKTSGLFEMEDGVSLQFSQVGGMRFIVKMDETVYDFVKDTDGAELGFVIAPKNLMLEANGDYLNMPKKIGGSIDKNKVYDDGEYYYANGCIQNVKHANLERSFVAVAYIQYGGEVRYTDYNDLARNNLYDLVNMATLNGYAKEIFEAEDGYSPYVTVGQGDENGWYGTEDFPIFVENTADYNGLIEAVDELGVDLSDYSCVIENNATPTNGATAFEKMPTIISASLYNVNNLIAGLPDSVTMPDAIGVVAKIRAAEKAYKALTPAEQAQVEKYEKVESLLSAIDGYDRVYKNDADDNTVIPSYVPGGYASSVGGSATTRQDDVYGNVLTVTSDADGRAALSFTNFPDVSKYEKIYFYVRILGVSCDIYLSDGTSNDGWGDDWNNTWSTEGFWCNAENWRLIEIDLSDENTSNDYIGNNFALGFRTQNTGITFEISDFYGYVGAQTGALQEAELNFGTKTDSGESNEYGKVYNISREQWYIDNNNVNTIGTLQQNKLANALPEGYEYFYFYVYNGTGTEYNFHLAGDVSGAWTDSKDSTPLKVGEWTKVIISNEDIQLNKNGQWYVYILGGDGQGAAKDGWKISTIYAGPDKVVEYVYTDYADVKEVIALINALPDTITTANKAAVEKAVVAFEKLTADQQAQVNNYAKLTAAQAMLADMETAQEVVALIDSINARDIDEALVNEARAMYNELSDTAKAYVSNYAKLEAYEAEIKEDSELATAVNSLNTTIANLPDSVVMPDHLVFVSRIEAAKEAYEELNEEGKSMVENYAKLRTLVSSIQGYTTVYRQSVDGVSVIPSYVPGGYSSPIGGSASMGNDGYYGDYLKVTSSAGGRAAIQFKNFPDVSKYSKLYFNIRVVGASCDIYLSDGISNDGWGDGWNNTWSMSGFWTNNGNWIQKEVAVSTGIFSSNWALGLRTQNTDVSFEITDIIGWAPELGRNTGLTFGNFNASGTTNEYGTVYNFTQGWSSDADMGAFNTNALSNTLTSGEDSLHFWIYNPNDSAVDFRFSGDMNDWNPQGEYVTNLAAKAWTEVVITKDIIEEGKQGTWFVGVTTGAGTAGWQISPIYAYNSQATSDDAITQVQARIDALNTTTPDDYQVELARAAYEELNETEKQLVVIDNLIACETKLYGDVDKATFIKNGATQYKIYYEEGLKSFAMFAQQQIEDATGVRLPLVSAKPENITKYRYAIVFGYDDLAQNLGYTDNPNEEEIGTSGYAVKRIGRTVFILAHGNDGYRMGALAFLREVVGYDMIAEDCVVYDTSKATELPAFELVQTPSFAYRQQQTYMTKDEVLGMGLQAHTDLWIPSSEGMDMHNTLHYLPTATYRSAHPAWYYDYKDSAGTARTQICPTAGGSSAEFNAMVEAIANNMLVQINAYPERENISFSIMDTADKDDCQCARCKLYDTLYGEGGFAAAWIDLMNAINAKIRPQIGDRKLNIAFLAYRGTEKAPASIDGNGNVTLMKRFEIHDNGSYTKTDKDLKCDEGVMVWLAPINGKFAENFNHADNAETLATIKKWTTISNNVFVWLYGTNFKNYMYPYNSWKASAENYKILAGLGVKGVWSQSNETEATAFSDLKGYIDSKFMFNVNAKYEEVLNTYFTNYFGAGATQMREMFDKIVAKCEEIESSYSGLGRGIYDEIENTSGNWLGIGKKTYWTKNWCNELVALCDSAKAAVDASALTDAQKTVIKNRITKESLFPRYLLCTTFASDYSSSDRKPMREAFKADADMLGFTLYREASGNLTSLYSSWGV